MFLAFSARYTQDLLGRDETALMRVCNLTKAKAIKIETILES